MKIACRCAFQAIGGAKFLRISVLFPNRLLIRSTANSAVWLRTSSGVEFRIQRGHASAIDNHLHAQLRFAVSRSAAHGGANARRNVRVERKSTSRLTCKWVSGPSNASASSMV